MDVLLRYTIEFALSFALFILIAASGIAAFWGNSLINSGVSSWWRTAVYAFAGTGISIFLHLVQDHSAKTESALVLATTIVSVFVLLFILFFPFVAFSQWRFEKRQRS